MTVWGSGYALCVARQRRSDYSARLAIGSKGAVANVILDTGSSALALDGTKYKDW